MAKLVVLSLHDVHSVRWLSEREMQGKWFVGRWRMLMNQWLFRKWALQPLMNKLNTGPLEKSIEDGKPSFVTTIPTPQAPSAQQQCHPHQETWGEDSARTPCGLWMCYEDFRQNMENFTRNGMLSSMETSEIFQWDVRVKIWGRWNHRLTSHAHSFDYHMGH